MMFSTLSKPALASALIATLALGAAPGSGGPAKVSYLANAGFLLVRGEKTVLIDGLFGEGLKGYSVVSPRLRELAETGRAPFDGVDLVLATHHHEDHFDPQAVGRHLLHNPGARFISTRQAEKRLRAEYGRFEEIADRVQSLVPDPGERVRVAHAGIEVDVFSLHHGRDRPIENLGFLVILDEWKALHVGDTEATRKELQPLRLEQDEIDVAFLPYWQLVYEKWQGVREALAASRTVAMHLPLASAPPSYFDHAGGLVRLIDRIEDRSPGVQVPRRELESIDR